MVGNAPEPISEISFVAPAVASKPPSPPRFTDFD